jgi:hypothetical protein
MSPAARSATSADGERLGEDPACLVQVAKQSAVDDRAERGEELGVA